ncbi:MAG: ABC transporter substrate-binding protein [Acetobacteraceae bacterium]|nr:ABC transporter substrate-binding protein [Acetobacteraceae bacterium]
MHHIFRRTLIRGAAASLCAPTILSRRAAAAEKIVMIGWGGTTQEAENRSFIDAYQTETGNTVVVTDGPDLGKLKAQIMNGAPEWDVLELPGPQAISAERQGLLEKLDTKIVDTADMFIPARQASAPFYVYPGGIAYDPTRQPAEKTPRSWPQFWDPIGFPGRRGLRTRPDETLEIALMGDGVDPKKLYPLDVDRAFKALDRIKPHVGKWIAGTPETITLLQNKEIDFVYTYSGRVEAAKKQGLSVAFVYENTLVTPSHICVGKGTQLRESAMKLVADYLRPDLQAKYCNITGYGPTKRAATAMLSDWAKGQQANIDDPHTAVTDVEWWADNYPSVSKRFKEWLIQ